MEDNGIIRKFRGYFLGGMVIFLLLVIGGFLAKPDKLPPTPVIGLIFLSSIVYAGATLMATRMNIRTLFVFILIYQIFCCLFLREFFLLVTGDELGFLENIIDSGAYRDDATITQGLTFSQTLKFLVEENSYDISDYGFPVILRIAYMIGGTQYGNLVMTGFNILLHTLSTLFLYKTALKFLEKNLCKIIAILWGFNLISVWINVSGLKETVFLFFIIFTLYYLYRFIDKKSLYSIFFFLAGVAIIALFRIYLSVFFIIIFLMLFLPRNFYKKWMPLIWVGMIIIILNFIAIFSYFFPILQFIYEMSQTRNEGTGIGGIISLVFPLIGPFPNFLTSQSENANFNTFVFPAFLFIKTLLSIFGIYGIYRIVKEKMTDLYPMLSFFVLNTLLVVITGFELHYRFIYCALPCFIVIVVYGFDKYMQSRSKLLRYSIPFYIAFCALIVFLYNTR